MTSIILANLTIMKTRDSFQLKLKWLFSPTDDVIQFDIIFHMLQNTLHIYIYVSEHLEFVSQFSYRVYIRIIELFETKSVG